jgi:hypothetical protein
MCGVLRTRSTDLAPTVSYMNARSSYPVSRSTIDRSAESASLPESLRVVCWRLEQLSDAGYTDREAWVLATGFAVDLHQATDLLRNRCPHATAVQILL